jgi:hypothetical protein
MNPENTIKTALLNRVIKKRILKKREENRQNNASYIISAFIRSNLRRKQREKEADAFEKLRERIINKQIRKNYLLDLKAQNPTTTKSGKTIIPYDVLTEALKQREKNKQAKWKLEALQRKKQLEGMVPLENLKGGAILIRPIPQEPPPKPINPAIEKYKHLQPQTSLVVDPNTFFQKPEEEPKIEKDNYKFKMNYASIVEDATNSALSRLVELDGKQYIAQHLATESPNVKLKKSTLAQKLGLEERNIEGNKLFSTSNIRNETNLMSGLVKGSQEAKDHMAKLRAMRVVKAWDPTKRALKPGTVYKNLVAYGPMKAPNSSAPKRVGRLVKGSQEAKDHMAKVRAMRGVKAWDPTKRALKPGTVYKNLVAYGPMKAPKRVSKPRVAKLPVFGPSNRRGRQAKYTPSADTLAYLAKIESGGINPTKKPRVKKLPVFGPKNRPGRPSKYVP